MEIKAPNTTLAIILYLYELGFDFETNSAMDLIIAIHDMCHVANEDATVRYEIEKYLKGEKFYA